MKKTQVALAALALVASTAALADGVTVYGRVDASVAKQSGSNTSIDGSGNWDTSVFGIRGSEDLGNGLKASFNLETGVNIGNGASANNGTTTTSGSATVNNLFARLANINLSGGFGTLSVGTQLSPYVAAALGGVANNNESFYVPLLILAGGLTAQPFGAGGLTTGSANTGGFFIPNAISYTTPSFNGIDATVMSTAAAGTADDKYVAGRASYATGGLKINAGYHARGTAAATTDYYSGYSITASYQVMEGLTVAGGMHNNNNKLTAVKTDSTNIGASYNVLPSTALSVQYARNDSASAASILNFGLLHNISKRTYAYATLSRGTNGASTVYSLRDVSSTADRTGYAIGLGHNF
jgi:predicted porin